MNNNIDNNNENNKENNENKNSNIKYNHDKSEWNKKYTLIAIYCFLVIIASFAVILAILGVRDFFTLKKYTGFFRILTPVIYGFIIAYLLNPLLMFFQDKVFGKMRKKNLKYIFAILATYLVTAIIITLLALMVVPQVILSIQQLTDKATDWLSFSEGDILNSKIGIFLRDLGDAIQNYIDSAGLNINVEDTINNIPEKIINIITTYITPAFNSITTLLLGVSSGVLNIILGILMSVYLLISKEKFIAQVKKLLFAVCPAGFSYKLVKIMRKTHEIFGGFITGKIIESVIVGIVCFIGMSIFNLSYTPLITVIIAVTNVIPFFGSIIGGIIGTFFLAINDMGEALIFAVFILIIQQIDGNIIGPKILGSTIGLPAFWIIFSIIFMSGLFGLPGFFFGVPVFAVIYVLIKEYAEYRLESKGFPQETKEYIRNQGSMGIEDKNSAENHVENKPEKTKKRESRSVFYGKALHKVARNIMGGFGWGKNSKNQDSDSEHESESEDNKTDKSENNGE